MTDDFDFDFDVDRGRSASRAESREPEKAPETRNGRGNGSRAKGDGNGSRGNGSGNGSRRFRSQAKELIDRRSELVYSDEDEENGHADVPPAPPAPRAPSDLDEGDWLSLGDDDFEPGSRTPLREADDGPAGPPTPGEARNFAKEAR